MRSLFRGGSHGNAHLTAIVGTLLLPLLANVLSRIFNLPSVLRRRVPGAALSGAVGVDVR